MTSDDRLIRVRLRGSRTSVGAVDLDALLAFGEHFRRALRAVARERAGADPVLAGHPTSADEQASALRLVGMSEGSAVLELEPTTDELFAPVIDSLRALSTSIASKAVSEPVHKALAQAVRSLGGGGEVTVTAPTVDQVIIDAEVLGSIAPIESPPDSVVVGHVEGWLHGVDVEPDEIRIRDVSGQDWRCRFGPDLEAEASALLGAQVRAEVDAASPSPSRVLDITGLRSLAPRNGPLLRRGQSAAEVIAEALATARVTEPQPLESLRREFDPDDHEEIAFLEALRSFG